MKPRHLGILLILVLGMGAYIYYAIQKPAEKKAAGEDLSDRLIQNDLSQLIELEFKSTGELIGFQKLDPQSSSIWRVVKPFQDLAAQLKVENLVSSLKKVKINKTVLEGEEFQKRKDQLEVYGLGDSALQISYRLANSEDKQSLLIGNKNPSGESSYLMEVGKDKVYLVSEGFDFLKNADAEDYREMRLTTATSTEFSKLQIKGLPPGDFSLLQRSEMKAGSEKPIEEWVFEQKENLPVDQNFLTSQLSKLSLIRANQFLEKKKLKSMKPRFRVLAGFSPGVTDLRTSSDDQRPEGIEFQFFKEPKPASKKEDGDSFDYYILSDKAGLAEVSRFHYDNFEKMLGDYVRKSFDYISQADVESFSFQEGKSAKVELERGHSGWSQLTKTEEGQKLSTEKVEELLKRVLNLKAKTWFEKTRVQQPEFQIWLSNSTTELKFDFQKRGQDLAVSFQKNQDPALHYQLPASEFGFQDFRLEHLIESEMEKTDESDADKK